MMNLKKIGEPYGIPIYYQRMPEMVKAVSMGWVMFTGAADDEVVGGPGLYHWFEHVPFRGTKKFPSGAPEIEGPFNHMNGDVNAYTDTLSTCYFGTFHTSQWQKGLEVLTDLVANPLITDEAVNAERRIIHQEIVERFSSASSRVGYELVKHLYPAHPFGHPVLGSEETLAQMDAATLRRAHQLGYDRSRAVFFFVGNVPEDELMTSLQDSCNQLPDNGLSERRKPWFQGDLPKINPATTTIETEFASSIVRIYFPLASNRGDSPQMIANILSSVSLGSLLEHGGMTSPLKRIIREERQLVYDASCFWRIMPGGGYFGFEAEAKKENVDAIIAAFMDVINDPAVKSPKRFAEAQSSFVAHMEMSPVDPNSYRSNAINVFKMNGGVMMSEEEMIEKFKSVKLDEAISKLEIVNPDKALIYVFKGMGK